MIIYQTVRVSTLTNVILFGPCGSVDLDFGGKSAVSTQ